MANRGKHSLQSFHCVDSLWHRPRDLVIAQIQSTDVREERNLVRNASPQTLALQVYLGNVDHLARVIERAPNALPAANLPPLRPLVVLVPLSRHVRGRGAGLGQAEEHDGEGVLLEELVQIRARVALSLMRE